MKVLGISSGGGVSLYPFRKEVILGNIEARSIFYTPRDIQWNLNFEGTPLKKNLEDIELNGNEVDAIISSPDCGSGSILRLSRSKEMGDHKKNKSLLLFFEGIDLYKPKTFLFENLEGLFKSYPKLEFGKMLKNYRLIYHIAPVSNWGNSQIYRKRLVIVGIRKDLPKKWDRKFKLPHYQHKNQKCIDIYGDLDSKGVDIVNLGHLRESPFEDITLYGGLKLKNWKITETWNNLFKDLKRWKVEDRKFTTAPGVYRNRANDYPATARKANRQYDHNGFALTPRQLARIQGVPDSFRLYIDMDKLKYWINKGRALVTKSPPYEIPLWFYHKLKKLIS